jgi:hypothetical protein
MLWPKCRPARARKSGLAAARISDRCGTDAQQVL